MLRAVLLPGRELFANFFHLNLVLVLVGQGGSALRRYLESFRSKTCGLIKKVLLVRFLALIGL